MMISPSLGAHFVQGHRHAASTPEGDLYVRAALEDFAETQAQATICFFSLQTASSGELVLKVFGSGFLTVHGGKVQAITAVGVAEQLGKASAYMQTSLGAVSIAQAVFRLDRSVGLAAADVDELVKSAAVLPSRTIDLPHKASRARATSALLIGYPGVSNALRKVHQLGCFSAQAISLPFVAGATPATSINAALRVEMQGSIPLWRQGGMRLEPRIDPKYLLGAPLFDIAIDERDGLHSSLLGVATEYRLDRRQLFGLRPASLTALLDVTTSSGLRAA